MVQLSRDYDFATLQANVNELLGAVDSAGTSAGTVASESANSLSSFQFGTWDDDISTGLKNYCTAVINGMNEVVSDITGGQFKVLELALSDLITGLGYCITYQDNLRQATEELKSTPEYIVESVTQNGVTQSVRRYNRRFYEVNQIISTNEQSLDAAIQQCYDIIGIIESVQYNGTVEYTPATFAGVEEGGNGSGDGDIWSDTGGSDGHHYNSREAAIQFLMKYASDTYPNRGAAETQVDKEIMQGSIIIKPEGGALAENPDNTDSSHVRTAVEESGADSPVTVQSDKGFTYTVTKNPDGTYEIKEGNETLYVVESMDEVTDLLSVI